MSNAQFLESATDRRQAVPNPVSRLKIGFVLLDQFTLAAFSGLIDVLRLAADHGGRSRQLHASWTVMSLDGEPKRSSCGVSVLPNAALLDPAGFDYMAVCGGNDYLNDSLPESLLDYLRRVTASHVRLLGICTGTFAIAQAGLVGPRRVCVHWNVLDAFKERFPKVSAGVERLFIDEGDLITCAGSTAAIDLGLYLVARHCGRDKAQQAMRHMMLQDMRPSEMPQPHFYSELSPHIDVRVQQAAQFIEQRLDNPPPIAAVARYVGISPRQLERLFGASLGQSPAAFQRKLRLEYARWLILNSKNSLTDIAMGAGFADSAHLSRDFKRRSAKLRAPCAGTNRPAISQLLDRRSLFRGLLPGGSLISANGPFHADEPRADVAACPNSGNLGQAARRPDAQPTRPWPHAAVNLSMP